MAFWGKLLTRDSLQNLQEVITNLDFLAEAEAQIAEFYRLSAIAMPTDSDLWNSLAKQELQHADNARRMLERINHNPKLYKPGSSISTVAIRMFAVEMQRLVEQMNAGRIPRGELFKIALEIEDSAVEVNYGKIVKTDDAIFNMLARNNDDESAEHKSAISARMNAFIQTTAQGIGS